MDQVNSLSRVELDSKTEFKVNMEKWIDSKSFEFYFLNPFLSKGVLIKAVKIQIILSSKILEC